VAWQVHCVVFDVWHWIIAAVLFHFQIRYPVKDGQGPENICFYVDKLQPDIDP